MQAYNSAQKHVSQPRRSFFHQIRSQNTTHAENQNNEKNATHELSVSAITSVRGDIVPVYN